MFDLQKEYCAPGTQTRVADIDNLFCREIEKSFCAGIVYANTIAIAIPTIIGECSTHRKCSQIFHTCLQANIGSCGDGDFHDG